MCQQTDEPRRFEITDGPGELDVVVSMLRGEEITFGIEIDSHADELGRLPDNEETEYVIDGLWRLPGRKAVFGFRARSKRLSYELFYDYVDRRIVMDQTAGGGTDLHHVTGEYSLRTRKGWLTSCSAEAMVTVVEPEPPDEGPLTDDPEAHGSLHIQ